MFLVFTLMLLAHNFINAAEPFDGAPVTITFPDDQIDGKPQEFKTTYGNIKHLDVIKNTFTDLPGETELPIQKAKLQTFSCLVDLLNPYTTQKNLETVSPDNLKAEFKKKLINHYNDISKVDLLLLSDELEEGEKKKITPALVPFVAQELQRQMLPLDKINDLEISLKISLMGWLFHYLIENPKLEGVTTTIPISNIHAAPVFTNTGIAWLEKAKNKSSLYYYDFLTSQLPKHIITVPEGTFSETKLSVNPKTNTFCICAEKFEKWECTSIALNNPQKSSIYTIPGYNTRGYLGGVVFNPNIDSFTGIYENLDQNLVIFYPISRTLFESIPRHPTIDLTADIRHYPIIKKLWSVIDHYCIRLQEYAKIEDSTLLLYDLNEEKIVFEGKCDAYANVKHKPLDVIERYGFRIAGSSRITNKIKQCIAPHPLIPEYNNLISTRATEKSVKDMLEKWPNDMAFDTTQLCYLTYKENWMGKNSLLVYNLLPHTTQNAIREITQDENMKDRVLQVWYTVHASLKTVQWKTLDQTTKDKIDPRISKLLPFYKAPSNSLDSLLTRNLGALQQKTSYFRYVYGRTVKNMALAAGVVALAAATIYALYKANNYLDMRNSQRVITIEPLTEVMVDIPGKGYVNFRNNTFEPITGTRDQLLKRFTIESKTPYWRIPR